MITEIEKTEDFADQDEIQNAETKDEISEHERKVKFLTLRRNMLVGE